MTMSVKIKENALVVGVGWWIRKTRQRAKEESQNPDNKIMNKRTILFNKILMVTTEFCVPFFLCDLTCQSIDY